MIRKLFVAMLLVYAISNANAAINVPGGVQVDISYAEPNTNADGTPLRDLLRTSVYFSTSSIIPSTTTFTKAFDANATALTGNGNISRTVVIPFSSGKESNVAFFAVAVDTNSAVSASSNVVIVRFDTLSPGAPRTLTISGDMLFFNYREPITNSNGSPIDDLSLAKVYYNDTASAALRLLGSFPVSSPVGGGSQTVQFPLESFIKGSTVRLYTRFLDEQENQSALPQAVGIKLP